MKHRDAEGWHFRMNPLNSVEGFIGVKYTTWALVEMKLKALNCR